MDPRTKPASGAPSGGRSHDFGAIHPRGRAESADMSSIRGGVTRDVSDSAPDRAAAKLSQRASATAAMSIDGSSATYRMRDMRGESAGSRGPDLDPHSDSSRRPMSKAYAAAKEKKEEKAELRVPLPGDAARRRALLAESEGECAAARDSARSGHDEAGSGRGRGGAAVASGFESRIPRGAAAGGVGSSSSGSAFAVSKRSAGARAGHDDDGHALERVPLASLRPGAVNPLRPGCRLINVCEPAYDAHSEFGTPPPFHLLNAPIVLSSASAGAVDAGIDAAGTAADRLWACMLCGLMRASDAAARAHILDHDVMAVLPKPIEQAHREQIAAALRYCEQAAAAAAVATGSDAAHAKQRNTGMAEQDRCASSSSSNAAAASHNGAAAGAHADAAALVTNPASRAAAVGEKRNYAAVASAAGPCDHHDSDLDDERGPGVRNVRVRAPLAQPAADRGAAIAASPASAAVGVTVVRNCVPVKHRGIKYWSKHSELPVAGAFRSSEPKYRLVDLEAVDPDHTHGRSCDRPKGHLLLVPVSSKWRKAAAAQAVLEGRSSASLPAVPPAAAIRWKKMKCAKNREWFCCHCGRRATGDARARQHYRNSSAANASTSASQTGAADPPRQCCAVRKKTSTFWPTDAVPLRHGAAHPDFPGQRLIDIHGSLEPEDAALVDHKIRTQPKGHLLLAPVNIVTASSCTSSSSSAGEKERLLIRWENLPNCDLRAWFCANVRCGRRAAGDHAARDHYTMSVEAARKSGHGGGDAVAHSASTSKRRRIDSEPDLDEDNSSAAGAAAGMPQTSRSEHEAAHLEHAAGLAGALFGGKATAKAKATAEAKVGLHLKAHRKVKPSMFAGSSDSDNWDGSIAGKATGSRSSVFDD